ncbi:thioredoxin family protein [bacterium]|nr:thioredoxin family protein [bacterium]
MLETNLTHMNSAADVNALVQEHDNVMICCGRMGPMCIPVYEAMEDLEDEYTDVKFADMEFDHPEAGVIRNLPECKNFMSLPFVVYYKNGQLVQATSGIQSTSQVKANLNTNFNQAAA